MGSNTISWAIGALCGLILATAATAAPDRAKGSVESDFASFAARYPDLATPFESDDLRHPAEVDLIQTLMSANPGIRDLVEGVKKDQITKVLETDKLYRLQSVEVGPTQFPEVHRMALEAARSLGLHTDFRIFVKNNAETGEDVFGIPKHGHYGSAFGPFTILLTSGLVKALSPLELKFAIAREMGHVKSSHRFYTALAFEYQAKTGKLPRLFPEDKATVAKGLGGAIRLFFERSPAPSRLSEYSADRAGLVAVKDPRAGLEVLAKLARGDLERVPGFDLDQYLAQVDRVTQDLSARDLPDLISGEGFAPYVLNRVGELNRFGQSEQFKLLVERITTNPFLMEVENQYAIGSSLIHYTGRLAEFKKDPATARLDPLAREQIFKDLGEKVDRRQKAVGDLEALLIGHVEAVGLTSANGRFDDLISAAARRGDGRPFKSVFVKLADQIRFALAQPGLDPAVKAELEAKARRIEAVENLVPIAARKPARKIVRWIEGADLPALLDKTVASLREAAAGDREAFMGRLESLRPTLREAAVKLVTTLPAEQRAQLEALMTAHGGLVAQLVGEVRACRSETAALGTLFDAQFDKARHLLRTVPLFVIRRSLARYTSLDV